MEKDFPLPNLPSQWRINLYYVAVIPPSLSIVDWWWTDWCPCFQICIRTNDDFFFANSRFAAIPYESLVKPPVRCRPMQNESSIDWHWHLAVEQMGLAVSTLGPLSDFMSTCCSSLLVHHGFKFQGRLSQVPALCAYTDVSWATDQLCALVCPAISVDVAMSSSKMCTRRFMLLFWQFLKSGWINCRGREHKVDIRPPFVFTSISHPRCAQVRGQQLNCVHESLYLWHMPLNKVRPVLAAWDTLLSGL